MSIITRKTGRHILPRWRISSRAIEGADFLYTNVRPNAVITQNNQLNNAAYEFSKEPTIGSAAEVISLSVIEGVTQVTDNAIKYIKKNRDLVPTSLLNLIASIENLGDNRLEEISEDRRIAHTRKLLDLNPNNPMLWADMAQHFSCHGDKQKALRCIQIARKLAPNHRWMLRTAARFLVHLGEHKAAHRLLADHFATLNDPWLIAAELACAQIANRSPKFWTRAQNILKWNSEKPAHLSELAIAVAMFELEGGNRRKARKYIRQGLIEPTENVLAQVFCSEEKKVLEEELKNNDLENAVTNAHELTCKINISTGDFLKASHAADRWIEDEPFATRSYADAVYLFSLLDDYEKAERIFNKVKGRAGPANLDSPISVDSA